MYHYHPTIISIFRNMNEQTNLILFSLSRNLLYKLYFPLKLLYLFKVQTGILAPCCMNPRPVG